MRQQIGEPFQDVQPLRMVFADVFVLELPRAGMRDEYGIEASLDGRIDIRAGTVADHPSFGWIEAVVLDEPNIRLFVFF